MDRLEIIYLCEKFISKIPVTARLVVVVSKNSINFCREKQQLTWFNCGCSFG